MSDDEFADESEGIKSLRKAYEAQQKQNKELADRLAKYEARERQDAVAGVLKAKGLPPSAAKLYNGEDVSEDAVGKWLDEFADVFNIQSNNEQNDANAQNAQRVAAASGGSLDGPAQTAGQPILGDPNQLMDAIKNSSMDELVRLGIMPREGTLFNPPRR